MMAYSLIEDGDLTYTKADLVRVWREFPGGPQGLFLKKGRTVTGAPDPNPTRLYYGKSFIYPVCAAPFVKVFGTNGFLVLHALLLSIVILCGYLFLHARSGPLVSVVLATGFVMASVVPVYFVWLMPEVFNFSLVFLAYFCWLYKEVARPEQSPARMRWLFSGRSDVVAATLLGIATFSKVTNACSSPPIVVWQLWGLWRRQSAAGEPGDRQHGRVRAAYRRSVRDQQAHLGGVELSGRRARDLLLRVPIPERGPEARAWVAPSRVAR